MKNILLAVTGLTPQILTETLYYYTVVSNPPVAFDEIQIITTSAGKRLLIDRLLTPDVGYYHMFCRDYGVSGIRFDASCIMTIGEARPLDDIRSVEDNGLMAAQLLCTVKKLTADLATALYCSLAGGRKTMGAYLALALQLYGRPQDRLSHVLVSPEFESNPAFFYPPPTDTTIQGTDSSGKPVTLHTKDAKVELADIPFISVRSLLPRRRDYPIEELVRRTQASVVGSRQPTTLRISLRQKKLWVSDVAVRLQPKELALYTFFATARKRCVARGCRRCSTCSLSMSDVVSDEHAHAIFDYHRQIAATASGQYQRARAAWDRMKHDEKEQSFAETISKINAKLRKTVSESDYPLVEISAEGGYGKKRYGIRVAKKQIEIAGI